MIIVLKPHTSEENIHRVENLVKKHGLDTHLVQGTGMTIIGCIGDTTLIDSRQFEIDTCVDKVMHVQEPYKLANRAFHPEDSIIDVSGVKIGGEHLGLIAGPCSVESYEQVLEIAQKAKTSGANLLRGGAFKPRTSPYAFQGLGLEGLDILCAVREEVGLPIVTELMSSKYLDVFNEKVDLIQIGARNMQNFELLKVLGKTHKPILLKRGLSATIEENDVLTKAKMAQKFLQGGDKVKVSIRFRGRQITHSEIGMQVMQDFAARCSEVSSVERRPMMDGRHMIMILAPKAAKASFAEKKAARENAKGNQEKE